MAMPPDPNKAFKVTLEKCILYLYIAFVVKSQNTYHVMLIRLIFSEVFISRLKRVCVLSCVENLRTIECRKQLLQYLGGKAEELIEFATSCVIDEDQE